MNIEQFMKGYKAAWEAKDESMFCALFAMDGVYHNTPFAEQRGYEQLAKYWERIKLQDDIAVTYEILASAPSSGIAHWHVTYQVTSEELFRIWAASTGTNLVARKPGAPCRGWCWTASCKRSFPAVSARPAACGGTACRWPSEEPLPMDTELDRWWPDLGTVVAELRRADQQAAADALVDAVRAGSTSSEILGAVGAVLRERRAFRSRLSESAARSWDAVMADVDRAFPPSKPVQWLDRLTKRST